MSPWLTFVFGIIVGLLIGWVIDLLYRRRAEATRDLEQDEPDLSAPTWARPPDEVSVGGDDTAPAETLEAAASDIESPVAPEQPEAAEEPGTRPLPAAEQGSA